MIADKCWDVDPDNRATFSQLKRALNSFLVECQEQPPVDLEYALHQQARGN